MKKRILCLVMIMMLAISLMACGKKSNGDSSLVSQKEFESYLSEPIEITTENWQDFFYVIVDEWSRTDVHGGETEMPAAAICLYEKPGYLVYEADGPVHFVINGMEYEYYNGRMESVFISDYYNLVCEEVSGSIRMANIPDELWTNHDNLREVQYQKGDTVMTCFDGYVNAPFVTEKDISFYDEVEMPSGSGVANSAEGDDSIGAGDSAGIDDEGLTTEKFETYIVERIELTPENIGDYFEVVEQEMYIYSSDGSEITGGWSEYYLQLKEGYFVYPDPVTVTRTRQTTSGTENTDYIFEMNKRKVYVTSDRLDISDFSQARGTLIRVDIPEEKCESDGDAGYCVYILDGEEEIYFKLY